jgi:rhamnosyltransferase
MQPASPRGCVDNAAMSRLADSTAAVLVVYRHPSRLRVVLQQLRESVAATVVVDNREQANAEIEADCAAVGAMRLHNANRGALAGAYNVALNHLHRKLPQLQYVVFLDDDSDCAALARFLDDPDTTATMATPGTAAVCAAYRDRTTGLRARYMQLARWRFIGLPREFTGIRPVAFIINSMSLWTMAALARIGPFDEWLGLDHIDTDACLRARRAGLCVFVNGSHEFPHSIGERQRFRFLGREMQAGGHPPWRRWLIARNTAWLARRELLREPAFAMLCVLRLIYEATGILAVEAGKPAKLWALVRGTVAGLFAPWRR